MPRKPTNPSTSKRRPDWKPIFLASLARQGVVAQAAEDAGKDRSYVYQARRADPEFAQAWAEVEEKAIDVLEQVAIRRAASGSDSLLMFLLKTRRPERYAERLNPLQLQQVKDQARAETLREIQDSIARLPPDARRLVMGAMAEAARKELTP